MSCDFSRLQPLGWRPFFAQQLTLDQLESHCPARVVGVERDRLRIDAGDGVTETTLAGRLRHATRDSAELPTVGDWVLIETDTGRASTCLVRSSVVHRQRSGAYSDAQVIAANIDLLVVIAALSREFNLHRIERYLVIAAHSGITPLVVLTKADLCPDPESYRVQVAKRIRGEGEAVALNALTDDARVLLQGWLRPGTTFALVGSSGVGKSTLLNNLAGMPLQSTGTTRGDDKGRHTTTSRSLHRLPGDLCAIDVPGLREVGMPPEDGGVSRRFAELERHARSCRFGDCRHDDEPGCAVQAAVEAGELEPDELSHYRRLLAEERRHVERKDARHRASERAFGKMVRSVMDFKRRRQGR